jgi:hypothetical protein
VEYRVLGGLAFMHGTHALSWPSAHMDRNIPTGHWPDWQGRQLNPAAAYVSGRAKYPSSQDHEQLSVCTEGWHACAPRIVVIRRVSTQTPSSTAQDPAWPEGRGRKTSSLHVRAAMLRRTVPFGRSATMLLHSQVSFHLPGSLKAPGPVKRELGGFMVQAFFTPGDVRVQFE